MKRRTLDIAFVAGGLLLAVLLLVMGLVLRSNSDFAKNYVHDQLSQQKITFTPVENLNDVEKKAACLVDNAGKDLVSGKQAECYANRYIALHLGEVNEGKTYSQTSGDARAARTAATEATDARDANADQLDEAATALEAKVETLFRGETLRGLLLTSYGFSEFGRKADQATTVSFLAALVLLLASLAGGIHAFRTPKEVVVE